MDSVEVVDSVVTNLQSWLPSAISLLTVNTLSAIFVARSAVARNRGWLTFFWLSLIATSLVMAIVVAALPVAEEYLPNRRKCPKCGEFVRNEASICRHCHSKIEPIQTKKKRTDAIHPLIWLGGTACLLGLGVVVLAVLNVMPGSHWLGIGMFAAGTVIAYRAPRENPSAARAQTERTK